MQNGRIATFISRYQMEQGKLPEDPEERDDLIEGMVGRDNPARLRTTKLDIKAKGQQEIAFIALLRGRPGRSLCAYGVPLSALVPARDVRRLGEVRAGDLASQGHVSDVPRQSGFFVTEVEPILHRARRAWVIVSDALRYEVAAELADRLERTTQGQTHLSSVQAVFPSITACGMAALLPHASLRLVTRVDASCHGAFESRRPAAPLARPLLSGRS